MRIRLTKLDDASHALEIERSGSTERVELETRSTLFHDLTHFAVEEAARPADGFFVALARGATLDELASQSETGYPPEVMEVERAVAVLQGLARADQDPDALHARIVESLALQDQAPPGWFTVELVRAVRTRLRGLVGHWRATPYGEAMELDWPAQD